MLAYVDENGQLTSTPPDPSKKKVLNLDDIQLGARNAPPPEIPSNLPLKDARDEFEKQYILSRLRDYAGNISRTAEALGVERSNLYRKLNAYGIKVERP